MTQTQRRRKFNSAKRRRGNWRRLVTTPTRDGALSTTPPRSLNSLRHIIVTDYVRDAREALPYLLLCVRNAIP